MDKYNKHKHHLLHHQHDVHQHEKEKMTYKKYQAKIKALRNLIITNIEKSFVPAHNNSISEFRLVDNIFLMDYIQTNYGNVHPKKLQENEIPLDAQWDPTTPTAVLFTRIED